VLALTLVVRNEEDILAANLDYHLAQGVDVILALDHGSSDRTPEILRDFERTGQVRSFRDDIRADVQAQRVNHLLRIAAEEHGADWVIHCDADEFWMPAVGSLRDVFAVIPERYGYIQVARNNFLAMPDDQPFHQRMVVRHRRSVNPHGTRLEPKVAQRPSAARAVAPGNHDLEAPVMDAAPDIGAVEVLHFQLRTFEQFERKVVRNGVGHECNHDRAPATGCDQLELLAMHRRGELRAYYDAEALDNERIERGLALGELVIDRRLQAFLSTRPIRAEESPAAQELLRRMWDLAGWGAEARNALAAAQVRARALEAQLDALEAQLDETTSAREAANARISAELTQARGEVAELHRTLAIVRSSRIMRYSASARRIYHLRRRAQQTR
jgi:hypothetical protein